MLKIQYQDGSGAPVELLAPGKTIGQGVANDIVIDKDGVNGFHADIQVDGDVVSITDINTSTGTMVKRFPVPPRCASVTWSRFRASNLRLWKQQRLAVEKPWFYQALRSWNLVLIPGPWSLIQVLRKDR